MLGIVLAEEGLHVVHALDFKSRPAAAAAQDLHRHHAATASEPWLQHWEQTPFSIFEEISDVLTVACST